MRPVRSTGAYTDIRSKSSTHAEAGAEVRKTAATPDAGKPSIMCDVQRHCVCNVLDDLLPVVVSDDS